MLIAAIISLIAGAGTVGALIGQLKQAASVHGATNYIVQNSFDLHVRRDYHLHTTQTRRMIAQQPPHGKR